MILFVKLDLKEKKHVVVPFYNKIIILKNISFIYYYNIILNNFYIIYFLNCQDWTFIKWNKNKNGF